MIDNLGLTIAATLGSIALIASGLYYFWLRFTVGGVRNVLDNIERHWHNDFNLIESAIKRIGRSPIKNLKDLERLRKMLLRSTHFIEVVENQLTYNEKINAYINILKSNEYSFHEKAIERLGLLAKKDDQIVIDTLLEFRYKKETTKALKRIVNKGNEKVINGLIKGRITPEEGKILASIADKGDQRVIEALLQFVGDYGYGVDFFIDLGATKEQCFHAALKGKKIFLLEKIVFEGELIDPEDNEKQNKIKKAEDILTTSYIDSLTSGDYYEYWTEIVQNLSKLAGKGNWRVINALIDKLSGKDPREKNIINVLGKISPFAL